MPPNQDISPELQSLLQLALRSLHTKHYQGAWEIFSQCSSRFPQIPEMKIGCALALIGMARPIEAMPYLEQLLSPLGANQNTAIHFKDSSLEHSAPPSTSQSSKVNTVQINVNKLLDLALTELRQNNPAKALEYAIEAKKLKVVVRDLDHIRALSFLMMDRPGDAREALLEELRHFPDNNQAKELLNQLEPAQTKFAFQSGDKEFEDLFNQIRSFTMLPTVRLYSLFSLTKQLCQRNVSGNFVECGVAGGGSSALLATVIKRYSICPRTLFSCDSFEGMPTPTEHDTLNGRPADDTGWGTGTCAAPEHNVKALCESLGLAHLLKTVKGYFEESLPKMRAEIGNIAFLHIDCDWYKSALTILDNLYDNIVPGGVVQLDDYGYWQGIKTAMDEFQSKRNLRLQIFNIDGGSAWFVKP